MIALRELDEDFANGRTGFRGDSQALDVDHFVLDFVVIGCKRYILRSHPIVFQKYVVANRVDEGAQSRGFPN